MKGVYALAALAVLGAMRLAWARTRRGLASHVVALGGTAEHGRMQIRRRGVLVEIGDVTVARYAKHHHLTADVVVPSGLRMSARLLWESRALPKPRAIWDLPIVREDDVAVVRSDDARRVSAVTGLDDALARMRRAVPLYALGCDGTQVVCRLDGELDRAALDAIVDAMVALARDDDGATDALLALDGATLLEDHELDPGVALDAGLLIGVRGGAVTVAQLEGAPIDEGVTDAIRAQLARAGEPVLETTARAARLTWAGVERDPARLRAGVAALRSLVPAQGPYR